MKTLSKNHPLYTKEPDGTVQKWYFYGWFGAYFAVSAEKDAPSYRHNIMRNYHRLDAGKTIFLTEAKAQAAPPPPFAAAGGQPIFSLE